MQKWVSQACGQESLESTGCRREVRGRQGKEGDGRRGCAWGSVGFLPGLAFVPGGGLPCQSARAETCSMQRRILLTFMLFYWGRGGISYEKKQGR